jgi:hypothetical protein
MKDSERCVLDELKPVGLLHSRGSAAPPWLA